MKLVSEAKITDKINRMKRRVRWKDDAIVKRGIDQTCFVLEDGSGDRPDFSFMVVGDSGTATHRGHSPQRELAQLMLPHQRECSFMLHTGDVIYQVGSSEYYGANFVKPYREFLVDGDRYKHIPYDRMVFRVPILPVPGNHDYYDLPLIWGVLSATTLPLRRLIGTKLDIEIGLHGSHKGSAYAKAFLDYLKAFKPQELARHLDAHYTAKTDTGRCLSYQPGKFTRLPNRYYTFRYGGIDFFAIDSNTINDPLPLPKTGEGDAYRHIIEKRRQELEQQQNQIVETSNKLNPDDPSEAEQLDDLQIKLEQIEEMIVDIDKQLNTPRKTVVDTEQLEWFKQRLIQSWNTPQVRGRIVYLHHPPYVTEATKWEQAQTVAVRNRLREVFNEVAAEIGDLPSGRPLVDLVLTGHAHCLEHLQTFDTGHADSNIHWIVCGGSGHSLRRQRPEGADLMEVVRNNGNLVYRKVARSHLFVGRNGHGSEKRRPYSGLRIDVKEGNPLKLIVTPIIAERYQRQWHNYQMEPITIS